MDLKPKHPGEAVESPPRLEWYHYQDCRSHLVFTLADGTTTGFPLSWLYRFDYHKSITGETFILHLTEHRVIIKGRALGRLEDQIKESMGFHLRELADRYAAIQRNEKAHIASISIESVTKPMHENN